MQRHGRKAGRHRVVNHNVETPVSHHMPVDKRVDRPPIGNVTEVKLCAATFCHNQLSGWLTAFAGSGIDIRNCDNRPFGRESVGHGTA